MRLDMIRHDKMGVAASLLRRPLFLSGMREKTDVSPKNLRKDAVETTQKVCCCFREHPDAMPTNR